jgi:hypothetical protein
LTRRPTRCCTFGMALLATDMPWEGQFRFISRGPGRDAGVIGPLDEAPVGHVADAREHTGAHTEKTTHSPLASAALPTTRRMGSECRPSVQTTIPTRCW